MLLVSELVTNAILHARSPIDLALRLSLRTLRVEVRDGSRVAPEQLEPDDGTLAGRGLTLVDFCAERWGVEPTEEGKAVWFELSATA